MEPLFSQREAAVRNGTDGWAGGEDSLYAYRTHLVVAFGVDEELEGRVEVAVGFADGADVVGGGGGGGVGWFGGHVGCLGWMRWVC